MPADFPHGLLSSASYTEIASPPSQAGSAAWADWDLSATIPVGAKAVVIQGQYNNTNRTAGARKNGSSSTYTTAVQYSGVVTFITELDANRIIEIISPSFSVMTFYAIGYFS